MVSSSLHASSPSFAKLQAFVETKGFSTQRYFHGTNLNKCLDESYKSVHSYFANTNTAMRPPLLHWWPQVKLRESRGEGSLQRFKGNISLSRRAILLNAALAALLVTQVSMFRPAVYPTSDVSPSQIIGHGAGAMTKVGKNRDWVDLSEQERAAANFLGFDSELWDTDNKVYIDRLTWEELSSAQKKAAKTLSFDRTTWNNDVFVDIYERSWSELTEQQKAAARELGYKKKSWNHDSHVWSDDKTWDQLSSSQQQAAMILGYSPQEWNDTRHVYEKEWKQLNEVQKIAAQELGYNEKRWNKDKHVFSDELYWSQLNPRQRWAARVIGYTEQTWNEATRAGSHAIDSEQARRKQLRSQSDADQCGGLLPALKGPFSFGRGDCSRPGKPWYVPNFMGSEWYNFVPSTPSL